MARQRIPVTLEDVARASGYSRATVSRVVNGLGSVDPAIAAEVREAIRRTGYSVNTAARTLAGGSAHMVGLLFAESFRELFQNPYWGEIVEGLSATLAERDYRESFLVRDHQHRLDDYLAQRSLDAVVIMSPQPQDRLESRLVKLGIPVVVFGEPRDARKTSAAMIDEERTGALAAQLFAETGRRHPVVISGREDMQVSRRRVAGFADACARTGIRLAEGRITSGDFTVDGGHHAMNALLSRQRRIDSVFACSDRMALGALRALHERGLRVPDDIAVIGVDGTVLGEQAQPQLTSVGADLAAIGRELGNLTLEAIASQPSRRVVFEPNLVRRVSA